MSDMPVMRPSWRERPQKGRRGESKTEPRVADAEAFGYVLQQATSLGMGPVKALLSTLKLVTIRESRPSCTEADSRERDRAEGTG